MKTLPQNPHIETGTAPTPKSAGARPRILLVEDDVDLREVNAEVLARCGYVVDAAEDGAAAWHALQAHPFDLLITDHSMPRMTGWELVRKLRSARMAFPVILASGALPDEAFEQPQWLQPAAILLKPFSPHQLLATVEVALCPARSCASVAP